MLKRLQITSSFQKCQNQNYCMNSSGIMTISVEAGKSVGLSWCNQDMG